VLHISGLPCSSRPLPCPPPPATAHAAAARRHWTAGELMEIVTALASCRTSEIASEIGVNPKALRSVLRRNGISLRALRDHAKKEKVNERAGLVVRRPVAGPSAIYGAAALAELPDDACRWPSGDPAEPDFAFCGCPSLRGLPYCADHYAGAFTAGECRGR
jgi:GcrA cell cycle regulator